MEIEINGIKYIVEEVGNGFQYYKIINGTKESPSPEELASLLDKLKELNNKAHTVDEIKNLIKNAIDKGELTDETNINEYLVSLNVTENIEELEEYAKGLLATKNMNYTMLDEIREKILNAFAEVNNNEKGAYVSFNRKKSIVGNDFLDIHLATTDKDQVYEFPNMYCAYNDETKTQLIEPVIAEVALKSRIIHNSAVAKTDTMDYTADYHCKTKDKQSIEVKDVEQSYAHELEKKLNELCKQYGHNLTEEEVQDVEEKQNDEEKDESLEKSDEMKLVRKKIEDKKGFANSIIAFIIAEVVAILLLLFTLIELF